MHLSINFLLIVPLLTINTRADANQINKYLLDTFYVPGNVGNTKKCTSKQLQTSKRDEKKNSLN